MNDECNYLLKKSEIEEECKIKNFKLNVTKKSNMRINCLNNSNNVIN